MKNTLVVFDNKMIHYTQSKRECDIKFFKNPFEYIQMWNIDILPKITEPITSIIYI